MNPGRGWTVELAGGVGIVCICVGELLFCSDYEGRGVKVHDLFRRERAAACTWLLPAKSGGTNCTSEGLLLCRALAFCSAKDAG